MDNEDSSTRVLRAPSLGTPEAVFALGLLCSQALQQRGEVHLHLNSQGIVEVIPLGELELDILPEQVALQALIAQQYTDNQLESYLQGREARLQRRKDQKVGLIADEAPSPGLGGQVSLVPGASSDRIPVPANGTNRSHGHQTEDK